jgi:hypothetical protein
MSKTVLIATENLFHLNQSTGYPEYAANVDMNCSSLKSILTKLISSMLQKKWMAW